MKKWVAIVAAMALAFAFPTVATADETTPPSVTVGNFAQYFVPKGKKTTVKPQVTTQGSVIVLSAKMTVKHGKKTVAKNVKSVKLRAGSYQVTTTVQWTSSGLPGTNTTVATTPLRISTFSASKAAKGLVSSLNAARLKNTAILDFMTRYGLDPAVATLHRSTTLDKIATSWAKKSAKKHKYVNPDWSKVPAAYEWAWYLPVKTGNPYVPTMSEEAATQWFAGTDDPMMSCGAWANGDNAVADCSDSVEALWSKIGVGFAWDSKGWLWVSVIIASHT
ncbi:MAG: hypothetical protein LWW77_01955 [Propionibacteriales bacterium]|nr:hypothetical protein [Propionibacteriales bacterium]